MATRLKIVAVIFCFAFVILIARLFFWQVVRGSQLSNSARLQYQNQQEVTAGRGSILSSDGSWYATGSDTWLVYAAIPDLKENLRTIANKLAPILVKDAKDNAAVLKEAQRIEGVLSQKDLVWIPIQHKVDSDVKGNIEALGITGIGFEHEEGRAYPEASSSAQVLGFVGKDKDGGDKGYFGLEGYYDLTLSGKPGFINRESDAKGVPILFGNSKEVAPVGGVDLVTHLDKTVQIAVENELKKGIELYGAKGGTVIVLNPKDGALMASASYPYYDPSKYWEYSNENFRDPAISDGFEPGSIFKTIVMAAGLDAGVVKPDTKCDICSGPFKVDKYEIKTWNDQYHPDSTMTDVIVNSDNVGMTFVGNKLGADKLYDYLAKFGFGKLTGIDLQGEVTPQLRDKGTWNIVDLATTTFGQGIAVTPIQMVRAVAVIANKGKIVKPQVVAQIKKNDWSQDIKPEIGEQVISSKVADEVKDMMVKAVSNGESKWAVPQGFKIAGKTGTAQIPVSGHYDATKTIASFVGFAPADNPKFVMLVTLREPTSSQWGSETAAPLWFNIARDLFPYLGIQPGN